MTTVGTVSSNVMPLNEASQSSKLSSDGSNFSADDFMTLLLAQLRNQNPMEPLKENEMIVQMSQMNSVQELQKLNLAVTQLEQANQILSGSSLIGKTVSYLDAEGSLQELVVEEVTVNGAEILLKSGTLSIEMQQVVSIKN